MVHKIIHIPGYRHGRGKVVPVQSTTTSLSRMGERRYSSTHS